MTKEILYQIQNLVKEAVGVVPQFVEPDFTNPMSYPCSWIEVEETPWEGLQQTTKRIANILVYFADRCLASEANNRMIEIVEKANALDKAIIERRQLTENGNIVHIRFRTMRGQSLRELGSGFVLVGVLVQVQIIYDQEV